MISKYDSMIDKLYDRDFKPINFDYKKYAQIAEQLYHEQLYYGRQSKGLTDEIARDKFEHIPNGVYYFSVDGKKLIPQLVFRDFDILKIWDYREQSDKENDVYTYYGVSNPTGSYVGYGVEYAVIAFYNNYYYGIGLNTKKARADLEQEIFDAYRNQILKMASKGKERAK